MSKNNFIVEVDGVSKTYHHSNKILKSISFFVEKGSFCALLGENGVGKSTVLNILMGQEVADNGTVKLFGQNLISQDISDLRNKIGLVNEKVNYNLSFPIGKFINNYGEFFKNWDEHLFFQLMKDRKLSVDKKFVEFSRGQKMQIALIAALAQKPELLLVDEITSVLDIYARKFFIEVLKQFTDNGGSVLLTTNIIAEIKFVADKIILLNEGVIQLSEDIKNIPNRFIKLMKKEGDEHQIFQEERCYWSGTNSDGSSACIVPADLGSKYDIPDSIIDRRAVTLDELFIYLIKTGDKNVA